MKSEVGYFRTVATTFAAGFIAWVVWEYSRPVLAAILPEPLRAFLFEFRFVVSIAAVIAALSLANAALGWIEERLHHDD